MIDVNILLVVLLYLKCSTSSCRYIREFFTSAKVQNCQNCQQIVYTVRSLAMVMQKNWLFD